MFAGPNHPMFGRGGPQYPGGSSGGGGGPLFVPPGARFDPIGPGFPGGGIGGGGGGGWPARPGGGGNTPRFPGEPDPDELRPPGFEDEYY